ncbi:unnamed protein product [Rotaria socialis]|uniref:Uncharacterized protein n=2 Tax=Rotaria socialis TaxID=392032 RepID=A0A820RGJ1_9BILA|nr:unnamed protein product [Rotaria socialis]
MNVTYIRNSLTQEEQTDSRILAENYRIRWEFVGSWQNPWDVTIPIRYWILGVSIRIVTSLLKSLLSNNDQLLEISKSQEDESLSYYNEYTRILILYNELVTQYNQLEIDYKSIQSLLQQKNEAYLQCQNELNTYQNLLYHQKKKSDDILECTYFLSTQKCILSPNLLSIQ